VSRRVQGADERFAGLDAELVVRRGEVGLHRLDAQEQLLGDRAVRLPGGRELTDLALAGGERRHALRLSSPRSQTARNQLAARSLRQQGRAGAIRVRQDQLQRAARFHAAPQPPEGMTQLEPDA
jgi:hypothetical protein